MATGAAAADVAGVGLAGDGTALPEWFCVELAAIAAMTMKTTAAAAVIVAGVHPDDGRAGGRFHIGGRVSGACRCDVRRLGRTWSASPEFADTRSRCPGPMWSE